MAGKNFKINGDHRMVQSWIHGFFSLPREVRNYIYWLALFPNHRKSRIGSTKILGLCSQIYREAVGYLKDTEIVLDIGERRKLLREPRATGFPNLLHSTIKSSSCWTPQDYSEIQLMRLGTIHVKIDLPELFRSGSAKPRDADMLQARVVSNLTELSVAISKSTQLKKLEVRIMDNMIEVSEFVEQALTVLGSVVSAKGAICTVVRDSDQVESMVADYLPYDDHLQWSANDQLFWPGDASDEDTAVKIYPWASADESQLTDQDTQADQGARTLWDWNLSESRVIDVDFMYENAGFHQLNTITEDYKLIPECRKCLAVFDSEESLHAHLQATPSHQILFRRHKWNPIHPNASPSTRAQDENGRYISTMDARVCWTCGARYSSLNGLDRHLNKKPSHKRHGLVPRWVEDNKRYDNFWRKNERFTC